MKFILWTIVWFGFSIADRIIDLYWWGNQAALDARYTRDVQDGGAVLSVAIWLVCYFFIVRKEGEASR